MLLKKNDAVQVLHIYSLAEEQLHVFNNRSASLK